MSFYASEPPPNSSTAPSSRPPRPAPNAWPPAALDQFTFPDTDPLHMGALPRHAATAPTDHDFSIADAAAADFAHYPADPSDPDRFLLDAARNDFDHALLRRSTPNLLDQPHIPASTPPAAPPAAAAAPYRQPWERPGMGISGCNLPNLPTEAFELADGLHIDPTPDDFVARSRHARGVGLGPYVERLMKFNEEQQKGTPQHSLERFWKPLISTYFSPEAIIHLDIKSINSNKPRSIKIPVEALPRIWKSKYDAGVNEERMLMEHPCEFQLPSGAVVVDCPKAVILTRYDNSTVQTNGHLRVSFQRDKKIVSWEFSSQFHEEMYPRSALSLGSVPPASCSEFGIPASVIRLMLIAENINELGSKIGDGIIKLRADPDRLSSAQAPQPPPPPQPQQAPPTPQTASPYTTLDHQKAFGLLSASTAPKSNGHAYRALLSQLDGTAGLQQNPSFSSPAINLSSSRAVSAGGMRPPQDTLDLEIKPSIENDATVVPNLREVINNWKTEPQPADVFPGLFDEAVRSPFTANEREATRKPARRSQADLSLGRQVASSLGETRPAQRAQSAIEAVAAAASGQGGWGVMSGMVASGGRDLTAVAGGAEIDRGLQLLNASSDATLSLHQENGAPIRSSGVRQSAPPGLSMFTPQSKEMERNNIDAQTGRRAAKASSMRERGSAAGRPSESQQLKDFDGLRTLQRLASGAAAKGDGVDGVQQNGANSTALPDFVPASQGTEVQNGANPAKETAHTGSPKVAKDHSHITTGTKRGPQRSSPPDDGLEKRQKSQNGEQK